MNSSGKVYLVGAGPGDPTLITRRGLDVLESCDAVVYDRLAPLELVVTLPARVQRHYVGKSSLHHALPQDKINSLLAELAQEGRKVVRLKGGDPFVFGRGGEEAQHLARNGISFEVIPGVTAGIAAAAYAGIPVTHRALSSYVILLTAHEAADKNDLQIPWDWLSQSRRGTIVGYMGVGQLSRVVEKLVAGGKSADTPAILIERGTTAVQRNFPGSLGDLPEIALREKIAPPALFIIGEVVALREELKWFEMRPLFGRRVMVTRPADQAGEMYSLLRSQGAEVLPLPTIATAETIDAEGWLSLRQLLQNPASERPHWLVFTSENGVRYFLQQLQSEGFDYRALGGFQIAAVGAGTARELSRHHLHGDFIPSLATTAVLAEELAQIIQNTSGRVVRVRGNLGDDRVERRLGEAGAEVLLLPVYRTFTAAWEAGMWACLEELPPDIIAFTSGSTVTALTEILGPERAKALAANALIASIGPTTSKIARAEGYAVHIEAEIHSVPGLVDAIVRHIGYQSEPDHAFSSGSPPPPASH